MKWFCPNCEIQMVAHLDSKYPSSDRIWVVECSMCSLGMNAEIFRTPTKDYDQVTEDFDKIPLTDSQKGTKKRFSSVKSKP